MTPRLLLAAAILLGWAWQAQAQVLELQIANGRVTLDAQGVSLKQILAAWADVGGTLMVNADQLSDAPVTLRFADTPEREVLAALLRDVSGYVLGPRGAGTSGSASVGRIVILAASSPVGGLNSSRPSAGFARQESAPDPDSEPAFQLYPAAQAGVATTSQAGAAPSDASRPPALFEPLAETVEIPGPGFVPGMVDDNGRTVRGPTSERAASEPGTEVPPGEPVQPNPFGVKSGSAAPGTIVPVPPPQP